MQAQQMSAYFSRTNLNGYTFAPGTTPEQQRANYFAGSFNVAEVINRNYSMRTSYGNRPNRTPIGAVTTLTVNSFDAAPTVAVTLVTLFVVSCVEAIPFVSVVAVVLAKVP